MSFEMERFRIEVQYSERSDLIKTDYMFSEEYLAPNIDSALTIGLSVFYGKYDFDVKINEIDVSEA